MSLIAGWRAALVLKIKASAHYSSTVDVRYAG